MTPGIFLRLQIRSKPLCDLEKDKKLDRECPVLPPGSASRTWPKGRQTVGQPTTTSRDAKYVMQMEMADVYKKICRVSHDYENYCGRLVRFSQKSHVFGSVLA